MMKPLLPPTGLGLRLGLELLAIDMSFTATSSKDFSTYIRHRTLTLTTAHLGHSLGIEYFLCGSSQ